MSDRRAYIAWVLSRPIALPLDIVRLLVREVNRAGASARRALLRYITRARIIDYWLWQRYEPGGQQWPADRLIAQMTQHWLNLGREGWTPREIRYVERRRRTQLNPFWWEQWGIGSR